MASRGRKIAKPGFVMQFCATGDQAPVRAGYTATKKIGNAVVRNRMKRRFRELLWSALPDSGLPDHDHILIGRDGGVERDFALLAEELGSALGRAAEGKGAPPRPARQRRSPRA